MILLVINYTLSGILFIDIHWQLLIMRGESLYYTLKGLNNVFGWLLLLVASDTDSNIEGVANYEFIKRYQKDSKIGRADPG